MRKLLMILSLCLFSLPAQAWDPLKELEVDEPDPEKPVFRSTELWEAEYELQRLENELRRANAALKLDDEYQEHLADQARFSTAPTSEDPAESLWDFEGDEDGEADPTSDFYLTDSYTPTTPLKFKDYEALSPERRSELKAAIPALEADIAAALKVVKRYVTRDTKAVQRALKTWREDTTMQPYLAEYDVYQDFMSIKPGRLVTVALGNYEDVPDDKLADSYKKLVEELVALGYRIVFDGHAKTAPMFAKIAGKKGYAIIGADRPKDLKGTNVVSMANPYMRTEAFLHAHRKIVGPDSLVGMAMVFRGEGDYVFDRNKLWKESGAEGVLSAWEDKLTDEKWNLGINFKPLRVFTRRSKLLASKTTDLVKKPSFTEQKSSRSLREKEELSARETLDELEQQLTYALQVQSGEQGLVQLGSATAPVFGSAKYAEAYISFTHDLAKELGHHRVPVVTGGAGGMMHVANDGAIRSNGQSIGIPITGRNQLRAETKVHDSDHTLTLPAYDYLVRIHLLLFHSASIFYVPGGMGTMREFASALVRDAANPSSGVQHVFGDMRYYERLTKWLANDTALPQSFLQRVALIDGPEDVTPIVKQQREAGNFAPSKKHLRKSVGPFDCKGVFLHKMGGKKK